MIGDSLLSVGTILPDEVIDREVVHAGLLWMQKRSVETVALP